MIIAVIKIIEHVEMVHLSAELWEETVDCCDVLETEKAEPAGPGLEARYLRLKMP